MAAAGEYKHEYSKSMLQKTPADCINNDYMQTREIKLFMLRNFTKGGYENIGISIVCLQFIGFFKKSSIYRPLKNKRNKTRPNTWLHAEWKNKLQMQVFHAEFIKISEAFF